MVGREGSGPAPRVWGMVGTGRLAATWRYSLAAVISLLVWGVPLVAAADRAMEPVVWWWLVGDPVLGLLSFVLIRWRHRRPALVAGVLAAFSFVSASSGGSPSSGRSVRTRPSSVSSGP